MLHTRPILTLSLSVLLIVSSVLSADAAEPSRPRKEAPRSEFFSYDIREDAAAGTIINSQYFKSIRTRTDENGVCAVKFYAPFAFGDRNVFFRSEGGTGAYRLWVNGHEVGGSDDTQTPSEVFISPYLIDGMNDIRIVVGMATCGIAAGADGVMTMLKEKADGIPVIGVGCLGHCYAEPIVEAVLDDGSSIFYRDVKAAESDIDNILACGENSRFVMKRLFFIQNYSNPNACLIASTPPMRGTKRYILSLDFMFSL